MALRKSPEEKAAQAAAKQLEAQQKEELKRRQAIEREKAAFFKSPAGRARVAFEEGDHVFQYAINVMNHEAIIVAMVGSSTKKRTTDPVVVLNSVCHEGWELVNGSFVFVEEEQQSRDKFMSSGQNVATKGSVVGYYLFRRAELNRRQVGNPWEEPEMTTAAGVEVRAS
ncbi:MAG: uncharacterized protein JWO14_2968 [Solirubrobacterales bacterium]|nr:uncharacterized protein [Solirubrobacterales bacterium]